MANGLNGGSSRRSLAKLVAERLSAEGADGKRVMLELAAYLLQNGQAEDADLIINDIADELYRQTGRLVVEVTSAHPLTSEGRQQLIGYLQDETGATTVELHEMVDESLIGGLVAKTPSAELDVSVKNTLRQLTGLAGLA
jgi:F0F1-type ATP synthase delta subunit